MVELSVIVPTRNRAAYLKRSVESLVAQTCPPERYEIIIVDNGSTDDTEKTVRDVIAACGGHRIRFLKEEMPGLLSGRHRGFQEAEGELLCYVDDDIEASRSWLESVARAFSEEGADLVGGKCLPRYEATAPVWLKYLWEETPHGGKTCTDLSLIDLGDRILRVDPGWVYGLNFSIRKRTLAEMGGFHPDCMPPELQRFQGDGETGLTGNFRDAGGFAVYHPGAVVHHVIPRERLTMDYIERRQFYQGVCDSFAKIRKHGGLSPARDEKAPGGVIDALRRIRRAVSTGWFVLQTPRGVRSELKELRRRMERGYVNGYNFHRSQVQQDPALLEWVLREDYFDYHLPGR